MNELENNRSRNSSTGRSRARGTNRSGASGRSASSSRSSSSRRPVMEHLPAAEAVLLVILPVREEAIPPDGAVDITERKARITRSLPLQV